MGNLVSPRLPLTLLSGYYSLHEFIIKGLYGKFQMTD